ncbi:uncharacterized protein HMPREF1541_05512 [Cyphellophora europaea CBS 101466]|uniref:C3HC-type domain-containing protein n=1 Tax=Cyphellophora europaea (strain CBS 101466) TaxID=1220924 RepID=W2RU94_CYPE1|nr:uncharacterized protein HMPREF1541_05512 [Cyphellophora europaea CBS 101466]ETN39289.1 hypothetical protein HMPREF1541_05512 [Cyphellophora europaea CBS 101466]
MSYELEAKKRKFDRILESLTDGGSSVRSTLNSRNNGSTISPSDGSDASKRRRITPNSQISKTASTTSLTGHYLPSSRPAFLERLETYRQVTQWHIPSTEPINASVWAKRGWVCVDKDTVSCGSCKERLTVDLDLENGNLHEPDATGDGADDASYSLAKDVYDALIKRYQEMIISGHSASCPWRKRGCDTSIQRIEGLLNVGNAISGLQERYNSIDTDLSEIPAVLLSEGHVEETELQTFKVDQEMASSEALKLAMCGWQRKCPDVIECKHCFRSLGLWLYRGEDPTIERLDAVEGHLEYCPWRSSEAQDSELTITRDGVVQKTKLAGWRLIYQAVTKTNARKLSASRPQTAVTLSSEADGNLSSELSPEQREKRTRDLMKRIKELRKPFNMKSLLRKKDKARPKTAS